GNGTTEAFPIPADYKRLLLTSNVWRSTNNMQPMTFVPDFDMWLSRRAQNIYSGYGEWCIYGGQMHIQPIMNSGVTAYYGYLQRNCIALASGGVGDSFIADGDSFRLDERLLKLGMIWQWKANKGSPYQEDLGTYNDAIAVAMGHDAPAPIILG